MPTWIQFPDARIVMPALEFAGKLAEHGAMGPVTLSVTAADFDRLCGQPWCGSPLQIATQVGAVIVRVDEPAT